jgi:hypothetical protein
MGGAVGQAGVDPDRGIQVGIGHRHDRGHGPTGREPGHVDAAGIDLIGAHDLAGDPCDQGRLAGAAALVGGLEPVPAPQGIGGGGLLGVGNQERVSFRELVHARARRKVDGRLRPTVQHDDQGHDLSGVAVGDVELVGAGPGGVGVGLVEEPSCGSCRGRVR